ncbi:MAG: hypothetical protein DRJ47_09980 [Thermoprotei archaeon]|nr:MAG: hypothetical protein DRJ47_09980 [Thermoprotei archaeon]
MRLLVVIPSFYGSSGEAVNERQLTVALAKKVEAVYVLTLVGPKEYACGHESLPRNIKVLGLPFPRLPILKFILAIPYLAMISILGLLLVKSGLVDAVYVRNSLFSLGLIGFKSLAKVMLVKIPAIAEEEFRNGLIKTFLKLIFEASDRLVIKRAGRIAVASRQFAEELARIRGIRPLKNPIVLSAGINNAIFRAIRQDIGRNAEKRKKNVIGFIGTLAWWQGIDILVKAISKLKDRYSRLMLYIIGDGEMRRRIEDLCKAEGVSYVITGFLPHLEALKKMTILDVLAVPSRRNPATEFNIPIKILEAWAIGIPVIATDHPVFREMFTDGEDLLLCKPDPDDLASKIKLLLDDPKLRHKLSRRGPFLAEKFDYDILATRVLNALKELSKGERV